MFKRLKEYLKKQHKEHQNNRAAYWDEESGEEGDVYGDYGRYDSCEDRYTCRWEDGCGGCPYYSDCGIVNDCYF